MENSEQEPSSEALEKIATALNVSLKAFFLDDKSYDIDTYDKSLVEKVTLSRSKPSNLMPTKMLKRNSSVWQTMASGLAVSSVYWSCIVEKIYVTIFFTLQNYKKKLYSYINFTRYFYILYILAYFVTLQYQKKSFIDGYCRAN